MTARRASQASLIAAAALVAAAFAGASDSAQPTRLGDLRAVGSVTLRSSCGSEAQGGIERATALLHSFFYEEARRGYEAVATKAPDCALAHWGVAMSYWHPIWTPPTPEERTAGRQAIDKARALGGKTDVERGLIAALSAYYLDPAAPPATAAAAPGQSCHGLTGGADHAARALAYEKAMEPLYAASPKDVELASFYALALLATTTPGDPKLENPRRAASILEPFSATNPNHPGVMHYLIHAYDYPPTGRAGAQGGAGLLEGRAVGAARAAHAVAHLHAARDVERRDRARTWPPPTRRASTRSSGTPTRRRSRSCTRSTTWSTATCSAATTGARARCWPRPRRCARPSRPPTSRPPTRSAPCRRASRSSGGSGPRRRRSSSRARRRSRPTPFGAAHLAFARALGAARSGRVPEARAAMGRLEELATGMKDPRQQYFARQAAMQLVAVKGWVASAEGRHDEAEKLLREAADSDDALGKHPVSPGSLLPAREMLADFLLERGRAKDALAEYERCLKTNPGRLNSLYGAGSAAERAGERETARRYYTRPRDDGRRGRPAAGDRARPRLRRGRERAYARS